MHNIRTCSYSYRRKMQQEKGDLRTLMRKKNCKVKSSWLLCYCSLKQHCLNACLSPLIISVRYLKKKPNYLKWQEHFQEILSKSGPKTGNGLLLLLILREKGKEIPRTRAHTELAKHQCHHKGSLGYRDDAFEMCLSAWTQTNLSD